MSGWLAWIILTPILSVIAWIVGYRMGVQKGATWLVRPHTRSTLSGYPVDDGVDHATVKQAVWGDTGAPGSSSKMD